MNQKTLHMVSLGCTKNLVDSEVMLGRLADYAMTDDSSTADVIIVNTCGFIEAAKQESLNTILSLHDQRKEDSLLVMSGCLSERYQDELKAELPEIDIFTGVGDYDKIDAMINEKKGIYTPEVFLADETNERIITGSSYHAYIKIAEGCNQACSFCAIPQFKGKLHSRTLESIIKEVTNLVAKGFWDFTFVSQDSSSYGRDIGLKDGLIDIISGVEGIHGIKSAKILYLYPSTTSFELIDAIADSKLFETYYDMPIQHSVDSMFRVMKRGFGESKTKELIAHMRSKPNAFIRTTFIVGHPQESEADFDALCTYANSDIFDRFNVFAYSNEESTTAFDMKQIDDDTISERAKILGDIADAVTTNSLSKLVGQTIELVIDGESDEHEYLLSSRPLAWEVDIDGEVLINDTSDLEIVFGSIYEAQITQIAGSQLLATLISKR
jgi:ribosomal protein S12 methylthiotransferase RimO